MNVLPCPQCGKETDYRWTSTDQNTRQYYYKCKNDNCRNHFRAVAIPGLPLQVTNHSPLERRAGAASNPVTVGRMGCPTCNAYGKVKTSYRRPDGYWRRHECKSCGPYHTCESEGVITVYKRLKSLIPIDNN